jgi:uroporphyrinogen-III synthase
VVEQPASPLSGKRVVLTRALNRCSGLAEALRAAGAEVSLLPLIRIELPRDLPALDGALRALPEYDWLVFTSQNAVAAVAERMATLPDAGNRWPASLRVAAVGVATEWAATDAGIRVAYTGRRHTAADLVSELGAELKDKRVLLPRSDQAAPELVEQLRAVGADAREIVAYRTVGLDYRDERIGDEIQRADVFLFFSPSAVRAFRALLDSGVLSSQVLTAAFGAVGPVTQSALLKSKLRCDFVAARPGNADIVAALATHLERNKKLTAPGTAS